MGKLREVKKEVKKQPQKSLKEKRQEKKTRKTESPPINNPHLSEEHLDHYQFRRRHEFPPINSGRPHRYV